MTYLITEKCTNCGACLMGCPVGALISTGQAYIIDTSRCIECGVCKEECPAGAIAEV